MVKLARLVGKTRPSDAEYRRGLQRNVVWLSNPGNGLFARRACTSGSLLLAIPPEALMNRATLKQVYPPGTCTLTAVQLISMHLFVWRPEGDDGDSVDPLFGPYISTLPRDFASHPLTWLVLSRLDRADEPETSLLSCLPPSVLAALQHLYARFWDDWCEVQAFLQRTPAVTAQRPLSTNLEARDTVMAFLWAWLNVNTRCIYYRLKRAQTDPDNVTMCPIVDFANHTSGQANMNLVPPKSEIWRGDSIGDGLEFVSPHDVTIDDDDEMLLTYGSHSNKTLFVEYGFVNADNPSGEVDVQDMVEEHVFADEPLRQAVKAVLIEEGYWGDWTLYSTAGGAQPSWRLITALRLYHLVIAIGTASDDAIRPWRDIVTGKRSQICCENEEAWRTSVVFLCDMLIERAGSMAVQDNSERGGWVQWMFSHIRSLWTEETLVAQGVKQSIRQEL